MISSANIQKMNNKNKFCQKPEMSSDEDLLKNNNQNFGYDNKSDDTMKNTSFETQIDQEFPLNDQINIQLQSQKSDLATSTPELKSSKNKKKVSNGEELKKSVNDSKKKIKWTKEFRIVRLDGVEQISKDIHSRKKFKIHFMYTVGKNKQIKKRCVRFGLKDKQYYVDDKSIFTKTLIAQQTKGNLTPFDSKYWDLWLLNTEQNIPLAQAKYKIAHGLI